MRSYVLHGFAMARGALCAAPGEHHFQTRVRYAAMSLSRQLLLAAQRSGSLFGSPLPVLASASPDRVISEALNKLLRHQPFDYAAGSPPPAAQSTAPIPFPMLSGFILSPGLAETATRATASASTSMPWSPHLLLDHPCGPIRELLMRFVAGNKGTGKNFHYRYPDS